MRQQCYHKYHMCHHRTGVCVSGIHPLSFHKSSAISLTASLSLCVLLPQKLESRKKKKGYHKIYLETASVLAEACKLYDSAGYQPVGGVETARCDQRRYKIIASGVNSEE